MICRSTARGDKCRNQKGPFLLFKFDDNAFRILADRTCESASVARFLRHYVHEPHSSFAEWAFWLFDFLQRQFGHIIRLRHRAPFGRPRLKELADVGYRKFKIRSWVPSLNL